MWAQIQAVFRPKQTHITSRDLSRDPLRMLDAGWKVLTAKISPKLGHTILWIVAKASLRAQGPTQNKDKEPAMAARHPS